MATTPSPLGVLSIVNGYPNHSRPSGRACCFVFGYRFGYWGTPVGPTPAPRPRRAQDWLDRAALGGGSRQSPNRPIARRIRRRRERPGRRRVRRLRLRRIGGVRRPSRRRRRPCRDTPLHVAAIHGHSSSVAELLLRGADGAVQSNGGYRCAAPHSRNRNPQAAARAQAHAEATSGTVWEARGVRSGGEGGALRPPPHSPATPPASRPIPPRAACAVGACRRRSPIQRGGRQPPTQHFTVTGALAARVPYCTGGSKCRSRRARAAAAIGSATCARVYSTVPRTARGDRRACVAC